jgi:hypothetical protein
MVIHGYTRSGLLRPAAPGSIRTINAWLPSWAPTTLGPRAHGTRPCGPCRGHSFQTRVTSPWSRYALRTAPTRTLPSGLSLTTWSRPHGSSRPTRVPALSRKLTVTSPRPGSAPRHLPDSDAPGPHGSPSARRSTRLRPHRARSIRVEIPISGRATMAPDRHYYLGDPLHGRHNYLPARRTPDPESACELPTTSSARCLHTALQRRCLARERHPTTAILPSCWRTRWVRAPRQRIRHSPAHVSYAARTNSHYPTHIMKAQVHFTFLTLRTCRTLEARASSTRSCSRIEAIFKVYTVYTITITIPSDFGDILP